MLAPRRASKEAEHVSVRLFVYRSVSLASLPRSDLRRGALASVFTVRHWRVSKKIARLGLAPEWLRIDKRFMGIFNGVQHFSFASRE